MLKIAVREQQEVFDEGTGQFTPGPVVAVLELEHSLVSLSKWEELHEKPFLSNQDKTPEEIFSYIKCMLLDPEVPEETLQKLSEANGDAINEYLNRKMTATTFSELPGGPKNREIITAELIYYWMTVFNIPFECENWHLNKLFTLIRICNIKQGKQKKMSKAEIAARNRQLNEERKRQFKTSG